MQRIVTLSEGRQIKLGAYVTGIKLAKASPNQWFAKGFDWAGCYGHGAVMTFHRALHERISSGIPRSQTWVRQASRGLTQVQVARLERRRLKHARKHGRECKWCGQHFNVRTLADRFCEASCARAYAGY